MSNLAIVSNIFKEINGRECRSQQHQDNRIYSKMPTCGGEMRLSRSEFTYTANDCEYYYCPKCRSTIARYHGGDATSNGFSVYTRRQNTDATS